MYQQNLFHKDSGLKLTPEVISELVQSACHHSHAELLTDTTLLLNIDRFNHRDSEKRKYKSLIFSEGGRHTVCLDSTQKLVNDFTAKFPWDFGLMRVMRNRNETLFYVLGNLIFLPLSSPTRASTDWIFIRGLRHYESLQEQGCISLTILSDRNSYQVLLPHPRPGKIDSLLRQAIMVQKKQFLMHQSLDPFFNEEERRSQLKACRLDDPAAASPNQLWPELKAEFEDQLADATIEVLSRNYPEDADYFASRKEEIKQAYHKKRRL